MYMIIIIIITTKTFLLFTFIKRITSQHLLHCKTRKILYSHGLAMFELNVTAITILHNMNVHTARKNPMNKFSCKISYSHKNMLAMLK